MQRVIRPELLDLLPPDDKRALRSRRDLCRVNAWMRNDVIMADALVAAINGTTPSLLLDLGAGDGEFLLRVARRLNGSWRDIKAILLDRQTQLESRAHTRLRELGWEVSPLAMDALDWARNLKATTDAIITNLFLHHFDSDQLRTLLAGIAQGTDLFIAVEPRRGRAPLLAARLLGLIGCNAVTRHDAAVSVHAGFAGRELSEFWPRSEGWSLEERPAGMFSHLFIARNH